MLQQKETVVVLVLNGGSIVEYTNVRVDHLVVTNPEQGRHVHVLLRVGALTGGGLRDRLESVVDLVDEGLVVDIAGSNNNEVITEVVLGTVLLESINSEVLEVVGITADGLSHHVVTVSIVVRVLNGGAVVFAGRLLVLGGDLLFAELELSSVKGGVRDGVSKHVDNSADVVLEASNLEVSVFTVGLSGETSTHHFNLLSEIGLRAARSSMSKHLGESVGSAGGGEGVLAGASTDVNTNSGSQGVGLFSANTDSVGKGGHLEGAVVLEGLGDFALGEVSEVVEDGGLGELEVAFGLDKLVFVDGLSFDMII